MKVRIALACAASLLFFGCGSESSQTTEGADVVRQDDPGAFAPAADPSASNQPAQADGDAGVIATEAAAPADERIDSGVTTEPASESDATPPESKPADPTVATPPADSGVPHTNPADTGVADTRAADTQTADTQTADTQVADTQVADTQVADTQVAETNSSSVVWRKANLTTYTSYPDPGSEECVEYNGCTWAGQFAALSSKQPESWVKANNIAAVHSKDFEAYKLKTLRLRQGDKQIDVKVYDMCADSDCSGCCTANSKTTGYLMDIEKYTAERFGASSGIVEWTCLDC